MKKLMALLLAATTAISMFATSASALFTINSYAEDEGYLDAYTATSVRLTEQKIIVTQPQHKVGADPIVTEIATIEDLIDFVEHLNFDAPDKAPMIFEAQKEITGNDSLRYGTIYMYDYALDIDPSENRVYEKALEKFDEMINELSRTTPERTDITIADFYKAWEAAYLLQPAKGMTNVTEERLEAIDQVKAISNDVLRFMGYADNAVDRVPDASLFDHISFSEYNMHTLIMDAHKTGRNNTTISNAKTSELVYLYKEYERVFNEVDFVDPTTAENSYNELYDEVIRYKESDFTADNWDKVQEYLSEAEALAAKAVSSIDWNKALTALQSAAGVKGIPVKYMDLQRALMSVYADDKGQSKIEYVQKEYSGLATDNCLYHEADFRVRTDGTKYVYSNEWTDFAINYYGTNTNTIKVIEEYSAYTWVYKLWTDIKKSSTAAKQSEVDEALERFNKAVDRLTPTQGSVAEWRLVMLQNFVDKAKALNEDDFVTTGKKWTTLQEAVADAENTLRKTNPSDGELSKVTLLLENALNDMLKNSKAVPSTMKKELKDLIAKADKLVANVTTQTGAQVVALRDAAAEGSEVYENIVDTYNDPEKATISEVQAAIDALNEAIDDFNKPTGWVLEDGEWFYGDYADGWYQIGDTWYMFNADGTLKVNEWFQVDGTWYWSNENGGLAVGWAKIDGKWYFFNQGNAMKTGWVLSNGSWYYLASSGAMVTGWNWIGGDCYYFYDNGAMAANTTIGGYKVDANGAWVK